MDCAVRSAERALDGSAESLVRLAVARARAGQAQGCTGWVCSDCGRYQAAAPVAVGSAPEGSVFLDSCGPCGVCVEWTCVRVAG